jgi:hypothetical protein
LLAVVVIIFDAHLLRIAVKIMLFEAFEASARDKFVK